jgi:hypothetical protein
MVSSEVVLAQTMGLEISIPFLITSSFPGGDETIALPDETVLLRSRKTAETIAA